MEDNETVLKCSICGNIPTVPSRKCGKCGGAIKLRCPECGHLSEWGRHYCEKCGNPLPRTPDIPEKTSSPASGAAPTPPKPKIKLELQSFMDAAAEHDKSFRMKREDLEAAEKELLASLPPEQKTAARPAPPPIPDRPARNKVPPPPPQKSSEHKQTDNTGHAAPDSESQGKKKEIPEKSNAEERQDEDSSSSSKNTVLYSSIIAAVVALGIAFYYFIINPYLPKLKVTMAAKNYLTAFTQGDYEKAYSMLSENSKKICPFEDYEYYNKNNFSKGRTFKNIEVHTLEPSFAIVKYQLSDEKGNWSEDYTSFYKEHNKWTRPYAQVLYEPIKDALARNDIAQALSRAQLLSLTDPRNPVSSSYLCMAQYRFALYEDAAENCDNTLQMIEGYPEKNLTAEEINTVMIYLADSLVRLNRTRAAEDAFVKLDERPALTPAQQCSYKLSRAGMYLKAKSYPSAKTDIQSAANICPKNTQDKYSADTLLRQVNGKAVAEAIAFAQNSKIREDLPALETLRQMSLQEEIRKSGIKNKKLYPVDSWTAKHLGGTVYRTSISRERATPDGGKKAENIFVADIDLWQKTAVAEKELVLPEGFR